MHEELIVLIGAIGIASLVTVIYLLYKLYINKDAMILGAVFPRAMLSITSLIYYFDNNHDHLFPFYMSILLVFISDAIIWIAERQTKKYKDVIDINKQIDNIKKLENKFFLTLENAQAGVYVIDENGRFEYVNQMFSNILGYSKSELVDMTVYHISHPKDNEKVKDAIKSKILGHSFVTEVEATLITKGGKEINVRAVSSRTENGHPTITGTIIVLDET